MKQIREVTQNPGSFRITVARVAPKMKVATGTVASPNIVNESVTRAGMDLLAWVRTKSIEIIFTRNGIFRRFFQFRSLFPFPVMK